MKDAIQILIKVWEQVSARTFEESRELFNQYELMHFYSKKIVCVNKSKFRTQKKKQNFLLKNIINSLYLQY